MLGIVGIGQAGGNISDEAVLKDIPAIAINYSQKDLDSLENVEEKLTLLGSEGVGKDRNAAINLMKNNWESAVEFVKQHMSAPSIEAIMVVFSTGGGSGSGISPILIDMLLQSMPNKTFVACPILPDKSEVAVNQINALNTFDELADLDVAVMPIDNEQVKELYSTPSKHKMYKTANQTFVRLLEEVLSYTEKHSKNGVLDKKDLHQIFATKGISVIAKADIADPSNFKMTENDFTHAVQKSWKKSIFSPINYDKVTRAGVIFDGQEQLMDYLRYDKMFDAFKDSPIDLFEGTYAEGKGRVISILSGLSWINSRLEEIDEIIMNKQESVSFESKRVYKSNGNVKSFASQIRSKPKKPKRSVTDILSKYQH